MSEVDVSKSKEFELPNGVKVELSILKEKNFDNLTLWIRQQYMRNIRSVMSELSPHEQEIVIAKAAETAALMSVRNEAGLGVLYESVQGYARLCFEMIQDSTITFDEFFATIFPDETDYSKYAGVLNDMFFTVYNEMFANNLAQKIVDEIFEDNKPNEEKEQSGE